MEQLQKQVNTGLRKLQNKFKPLVGVKTTEIGSTYKATIYVGELPLMDGYAYDSDMNVKHLYAILNAIKNYDLTLID